MSDWEVNWGGGVGVVEPDMELDELEADMPFWAAAAAAEDIEADDMNELICCCCCWANISEHCKWMNLWHRLCTMILHSRHL